MIDEAKPERKNPYSGCEIPNRNGEMAPVVVQ